MVQRCDHRRSRLDLPRAGPGCGRTNLAIPHMISKRRVSPLPWEGGTRAGGVGGRVFRQALTRPFAGTLSQREGLKVPPSLTPDHVRTGQGGGRRRCGYR